VARLTSGSRLLSSIKMLTSSLRVATGTIRYYSQQIPHDRSSRIQAWAMTGYICGAVVLPFVPPYVKSKKAREDGTSETRYGSAGRLLCIGIGIGIGTGMRPSLIKDLSGLLSGTRIGRCFDRKAYCMSSRLLGVRFIQAVSITGATDERITHDIRRPCSYDAMRCLITCSSYCTFVSNPIVRLPCPGNTRGFRNATPSLLCWITDSSDIASSE
jgi:hypothetical protein